ncbi:MAG: exopolysaccharide biosynthesis polyprenyl glycosylphosphotransferase [Ardenticatenia bacterium]|nr:exopolysaccharide biosynthesis polyprenyl glycosylphosphotransferase [Ardenticatenia bacterium]
MTTAPARDAHGATGLPLDRRSRQAILAGGDLLLLAPVLALALRLGGLRSGWDWANRPFLGEYLRWLILLLPLWLALAWANGLYDLGRPRRRLLALALAGPVVVSSQLLLLWALVYFIPPPWTLVRHVAVFFALGSALALPLWRLAFLALLERRTFRTRLLIVGAGEAGRTILEAIRAEAAPLYEVVGFIDDDLDLAGRTVAELPVLGGREALLPCIRSLGATEVVLAITHGMEAGLFRAVLNAQEQGVTLTPMPLLYELLTGRVPVEHIGEQWAVALPLSPAEATGLYRLVRRAVDLAAGLGGLLVLVLLLPLLAPVIWLDSRGPILFRQTRLGRGGRPFTLYKLRTMRPGAEADGPRWTAEADPRVTRVGRLLRRSRLDELPQALNILRGEMSLIGPRPERPEFVAQLAEAIPFYRARHAVAPGLTGWAAVHQDYAASTGDALLKLQYDLYYIKHRSLLLDGWILLRTAAKVLRLVGR